MDWNGKDVALYLEEQEYIDTAVIPLLPVSFGNEMKQAASQGEFILTLTSYLESQFKGRLLLFPPFSYLTDLPDEEKVRILSQWEEKLGKQFKHIFYITSDSAWKTKEDKLSGQIVWMASIPLEHLTKDNKHSILDDQVQQLIHIIVQKWQNNK